jgi:GntR family transcriptional regulator, transcriptional repressor for pyruvate dehydrogenase complex
MSAMNDGEISRRRTLADAAAARPGNVGPSLITGRPQKTAMIVAQRIVNEIQMNKLGAGAKLPSERVMLEEYAVGRGTLREALRFLEFQGVVVMKPGPGGGPVVRRPDASHLGSTLVLLLQFSAAPFRVIAEARAAVEPMIAYLAAQRITDEDLERLARSVEVMQGNIDDRAIFIEENKQFHDIIAWSSDNALFGYLVDSILGILDGTLLGIDYPPYRRKAVVAAHRNILGALDARDPEAAEQSMAKHIEAYIKYAEKKYPDILDQAISWDQVSS